MIRILELERNAPASAGIFGKVNIEFWDVSGDWRYEKTWGPVMKNAHGIVYVLDPNSPAGENDLVNFQRTFMQGTGLSNQQMFLYVNHHRLGQGNAAPQPNVPRSFESIDKQVGTAEDTSFIFGGFERFYSRCLREMKEQQRSEEQQMMV